MIPGFENAQDFARVLHQNISPTSPIQSQEHLYGREKQVQQIEQALYSPGRSVFVYGDRGVGKTSLAQTVAYKHQSAHHDPVILARTPTVTFRELMGDVIAALLRAEKPSAGSTTKAKLLIPTKVPLGVELEHTRKAEQSIGNQEPFDLNSTVEKLLQIGAGRNGQNTVVVSS